MTLRTWLTKVTQTQSTRSRLLSDPYYRLQTAEDVKLAASLGIQIDVNRAGVDDWLRLPGLSIHQARTLTELTQAGVHLHSLEDVAAAIGVPVQRLEPLQPVLRFCYYDADSVQTIQPVNINTASVEALQQVPGIDLYLARAIAANRTASPYRNLAHFQRRLSLSSELTAKLMHYLKF